jgi:myo-inositol-1(or 4)-monophosphatase
MLRSPVRGYAGACQYSDAVNDPDSSDLLLAGQLSRAGGELAARMLAEGLDTFHKTSVSDVVSAADHAAEAMVVDRLRLERPEDGLVGEEGAQQASVSGRTWFIDPVDGTYNFLSGLHGWCSALAVVDADGPRLGAIFHPAADELWLGGIGHPSTCNGVAVAPLRDVELSQLSIASYLHPATLPDADTREPLLAAMSGAATVRMLGSGSIELAAVAGGRLGCWVQHGSLDWDWFPGAALVRAAGGVAEVFFHRGHRWHVAGNRVAVSEVRAIITATV